MAHSRSMKDFFNFHKLFSLIFIVGIAVVFTLQFGPGSRGCEAPITGTPAGAAAVVNGAEIPLTEFRRAYRNVLNNLRQQNQISESLARQLGYHKQVLDQLVNTELLAQAAEKQGIAPSDEEIARIIHRVPDFQKDGRWDLQTYRAVLRQYYRKSDVEFERDLRRELAAQKMLETVESAAVVSDDEVKSRFLKEGNRAQVTFVRFAPTMFANAVPPPKADELAQYVRDHQKEIEEYYNANKFAYSQPEQVRARHILIKTPEGAPDSAKADARRRLEDLRRQIVEGRDFGEVARAYSEDTATREKGGDLGFSPAGAWEKPFSEAAFALKAGDVSQPVETKQGVHLIKVEERRPPQNKELKDVESEIATILWKREKSKDVARAEADKALAQVKAGKDFKALFPPQPEPEGGALRFTQPSKPEAIETTEFTAGSDSIPRLGPAPGLVPDIFARTAPGPLDKAYQVGDAWVVVNVTNRKLPNESEFEAQKETLRADARRAKEFELRDSFLKALKKRSDVKTNEAVIEESLGPATTG